MQSDVLLFIFYGLPREYLQVDVNRGYDAQLLAAQELYNRGFVYHKERKEWFKRDSNSRNSGNSGNSGTGTVSVKERFDVESWKLEAWNDPIKESELLSVEEIEEVLKKTEQ